MEKNDMYKLMYPIGKFEAPGYITLNHIHKWMTTIEEYPVLIHSKISKLTEDQFKYMYRPNGWNITQVLHHISDSHTHALYRFKLALTEESPTIKPYHEGLWSGLTDYDYKLNHYAFNSLEASHAKWIVILKSMSKDSFFDRGYYHPESHKNYDLATALGLYDWHCRHHSEHISQALSFEGRFWE